MKQVCIKLCILLLNILSISSYFLLKVLNILSSYQERLRNEIERVGVTTLSKKLGIARNTLYNWSEKSNVPLDKLMAMGEHGLDVNYVVSGDIRNVQYSEQDKKIMDTFQSLSQENKEAALKVLDGLMFVNNGYVKQVTINNNQTGFSEVPFMWIAFVCAIASWGLLFLLHNVPETNKIAQAALVIPSIIIQLFTFIMLICDHFAKKNKKGIAK